MSEPTCGALYRALVEQLFHQPTALGIHDVLLARPGAYDYACFAAGFLAGQAEKVASLACGAFMIRPSARWQAWTRASMALICTHYGLFLMDGPHGELWGVHPTHADVAREALGLPYPSARAHQLRARLCGIPASKIDLAYHERETYGIACEPEEKY